MVSKPAFWGPSLSSSFRWWQEQRWSSKCWFTWHSNTWCSC